MNKELLTEIFELKNKLEYERAKNRESKENFSKQIYDLKKRYYELKESKLGRLQLSIWKRRNRKNNKNLKKAKTAKNTEPAENIKNIENTIDPQKYDMDFINTIKDKLDEIPVSRDGRYYKKYNLKVGIISDEFLFNSYKDTADYIPISPDKWRDEIKRIDILFIITGWAGLKGEWKEIARDGSQNRETVYDIIEKCRKKNIRTIFYSIEDPPNYNVFLGIAEKCEYIFTTAAEKVRDYKNDCNNNKVYALRFGINPLFHNPVGMRHFEKKKEVIFSGSWMEKYPERGKDIRMIFDGILKSRRGLKIIDRNLLLNIPEYKFPDEYSQYISPAVSHDELQKIHKLYDWAVNINSVKESATMFANRVYELEAAGSLLISNYSAGVNLHLPVIYTVQDPDETAGILDNMTGGDIYERQVFGIRHAMGGQTCFDRFNEILEIIGYKGICEQRRTVAVVYEDFDDNGTVDEKIRKMYDEQTYPYKKLITADEFKNNTDTAEFDIVAFFNKDSYYGAFYLEDMINAFKYTGCDYVTKNAYMSGSYLISGKEHEFTDKIGSKYRTVFWREAFDIEELLNMREGTVRGNGYASDHFSYNGKITNREKSKKKYKLSVIIPVFNNGLYLYGKAFGSLVRNRMFNDMEIILIDGGSGDIETAAYIKYLESKYDNVKAYFYKEAGNGSLFRERKKGTEMAEAEYIAYLDPENEAAAGGYEILYKGIEKNNSDIAIGNSDPADTLEIQAMIIRKNIIPEEEQLFLYNLFLNAGTAEVYDTDVLINNKLKLINNKQLQFTALSGSGGIYGVKRE